MSPARRRTRPRRLWLLTGALVLAAVVIAVVALTRPGAPIGYDVSYPQCAPGYPSNVLFGIVGVNGGVAATANPCLRQEIAWAGGALGQRHPAQPRLSLYIVTGNPGPRVADWPRGGRAGRYGPCNGLLTNACAWLYGERRAAHDRALVAAIDPAGARHAPWWLDVELTESWAGTYALNVAALQGYLAGLRRAGPARIGVYSTSAQWRDITGLTAQTTPRALSGGLASWLAGTTATRAVALANCSTVGFTGRPPTLAQYRSGAYDADLRCPA
ncbi:MAG TPA: hypothetical protein VFN36_07025 [Solirubrobacteraceae bacterium]|nr:hypothetical protein [Solirubrobacteraceae bacterium]